LDKTEEFVKGLKGIEHRLNEARSPSDFEELKSDLRKLVIKIVESDLSDDVKDLLGEKANELDRRIQQLERRLSTVESDLKLVSARVNALDREVDRQKKEV